jgi:hypothetical protein
MMNLADLAYGPEPGTPEFQRLELRRSAWRTLEAKREAFLREHMTMTPEEKNGSIERLKALESDYEKLLQD